MDKTLLIQLSHNTSFSFNGEPMGYTKDGLKIQVSLSIEELTSQRHAFVVGTILRSVGAQFSTSIYEMSANALSLLYNQDGTVKTGVLIVKGKLKTGTEKTFTFKNAYLADIGELNLNKLPEAVSVTFKGMLDSGGLFLTVV